MANKVYKKGKVHPSPPSITLPVDDHLSLFLPAAILALASSLPLQDKEVLAYFISCSDSNRIDLVSARPSAKEMKGRAEHAQEFECVCFRCYVSFWSRWDSSPNRHVIDEIIEAFEEHERRVLAASQRRVRQGRKGRKEWKKRGGGDDDGVPTGGAAGEGGMPTETVEAPGEEGSVEGERGLVRRIGTTIGFKIWNFLDRITM